MQTIKFGTDGWRGIIALDFTFENVGIVAQAIANYLLEQESKEKTILVGYDNRFLSDLYAKKISSVISANGIKIYLTKESVSTPALSFSVKQRSLSGGVMITASHNPPIYNGIKFKAHYGGSAIPEIIKNIEKNLYKNKIKELPFEEAVTLGKIEIIDITQAYLENLKNMLDLEKIKDCYIIAETMYGSSKNAIAKVLAKTNCRVETLHNVYNPGFGSITPEPIKSNLSFLRKKVKTKKANLGIASDGDGDRLGVISEDGEYVDASYVFALLLLHLIRNKKWHGKVVKTISVSFLIDAICQKFNLPLIEVPVGIKHICELMIKEDILIGGEESGGYGIKNYIPDKDGIFCGLLLIEMMAIENKNLLTLLKEIEDEFGKYKFQKVDVKCSRDKIERLNTWLAKNTKKEIAGIKVKERKDLDGVKFILEDRSWLLLRPSGTEPLIRVYAEAENDKRAYELLCEGKIILDSC